MNSEIESQLDELTTVNHSGAGMVTLSLDGRKLRCRVKSVDRLACEVESIFVAIPELASYDLTQMEVLADRITERVAYLEERLATIETDVEIPEVQIRSERPTIEHSSPTYFEVMVGRSGIQLRRYQKKRHESRTTVPMVLTRAILSRVCDDLLGVVITQSTKNL